MSWSDVSFGFRYVIRPEADSDFNHLFTVACNDALWFAGQLSLLLVTSLHCKSPLRRLGHSSDLVSQHVGEQATSQVALPEALDVGCGVRQLPRTAVPGVWIDQSHPKARSSLTYRIAAAKSASLETTTACSYSPLNPSTKRRVARFTSDPFSSESLTKT